jgi:hypothetical protein
MLCTCQSLVVSLHEHFPCFQTYITNTNQIATIITISFQPHWAFWPGKMDGYFICHRVYSTSEQVSGNAFIQSSLVQSIYKPQRKPSFLSHFLVLSCQQDSNYTQNSPHWMAASIYCYNQCPCILWNNMIYNTNNSWKGPWCFMPYTNDATLPKYSIPLNPQKMPPELNNYTKLHRGKHKEKKYHCT